jgi:sigma-B regulation protein RsbU (phosphoserine phosphatase)
LLAFSFRAALFSATAISCKPASVLGHMRLVSSQFPLPSSSSLFYALLTPDHQIEYFNAGHPPPVLLRTKGDVELLLATNLILSPLLKPDDTKTGSMAQVSMEPGDRVLFYTDGVTEACSPSGKQFGRGRLVEAFKVASQSSGQSCLEFVWKALRSFEASAPRKDDQSLVLLTAQ